METRLRAAPSISNADKQRVAELYPAVIGSTFRRTSCRNCFHDAVIEMYSYLKNNGEMAENKNYILKRGKLIAYKGKFYTRKTLTDSVAEAYLKANPDDVKWFDKVAAASAAPETKKTAKKDTETKSE